MIAQTPAQLLFVTLVVVATSVMGVRPVSESPAPGRGAGLPKSTRSRRLAAVGLLR